MPITTSAKKAMRQAYARTERNKSTRTLLKTFMKKVVTLSKSDVTEAQKVLPKAYKVIDTACKKNIIPRNRANRNKSMLARIVAVAEAKKK